MLEPTGTATAATAAVPVPGQEAAGDRQADRLDAVPAPAALCNPEGYKVQRGAEIVGLGVAVPETVVTNAPIAARLGIEESWIVQRTGIEERRVAAPEARLHELAAEAAERALADAAIAASKLDLVLVATVSNEDLMPGASPRLATAIGAGRAGAIDVNAACTGFVSALALACGQIESGRADEVLVVGADLMHRLTDPDDRATAAVFADGAGAVVIRGAAAGRIGPVWLGADGLGAELIRTPRQTAKTVMQGHETFRHAVDRMCEATTAALEAAGLRIADIDVFAYHQANARILRSVGQRLGLPEERVVNCIDRFGNTSAATVPLALEEARRDGRLVAGARVLLGAFGAGFTWGATVVEWGGGEDA
ncbi:MAG TPA: beta-ketoacyl-ACP synthase 3 [Solirubrobacterales bacterium]|jgi:3-oxoacyl-[acyl-carrier-protein] synthase-3|nr:beta-ketoacyl-ACP synthase 3 [Solirubrobacterales bacterium]